MLISLPGVDSVAAGQDYLLDSNYLPCYIVLDESFSTLSG
jgi:hypothetical protein